AAIGTVVKQGHNLERLELDEAIEVLLEKAGLKDSPKSDYEEARQIVQLLGCLPLAIDQAGAFIKSRRKTLIGYSKLYKERQLELLKFKPRLVEYDKNILTTWEINFAQVERDSQASSDILLLCCFLDGAKIVERMLVEGVSPQVRWGPDGEKVNLAAEEDGVDKDLVALITDEIAFDEAIEKLLSFSLIQCFDTSDGTRTFSVHPLVQYCASQRVPLKRQNKWRSQAIRLVCHAFPREKFLHAVNAHFGATMLPQIDRSLKEYDSGNEQDIGRAATSQYLAETLVSASRFSTTSWKLRCIERAKGLLNSDSHNYLRAAITYRNSSLIRMTGNKEKSNESLKQFIYASDYSKLSLLDPRDNAHRFDLITSYAQNFVQESKLAAAREELSNWLPLNISSPSSMERLALKNRNTTLGKILRYEGQFAEALTYLEYLLEQSNDEDGGVEETPGWRHLLLSNIADLYTELDRPADAEAMLESEIAQMRSENWAESGSSKRLQLSLIEAFMRHNKLQKAVQWLLPLQHHFEKIKEPDVLTKRGLFRVRTTLARVAHFRGQWDKALFNWKEALNVTESLGERESFSGGQVKCAFAYTLYTLGRVAEGLVLFKQAQQNLASQKRFFYLVGFDSYWHDTIMRLVRECYSNQDVVQ
ncbi:hypothetical protein MMC25_007893, partial [Agyrium rufum]|nr:hypothetical protein [Agyrium rufum]